MKSFHNHAILRDRGQTNRQPELARIELFCIDSTKIDTGNERFPDAKFITCGKFPGSGNFAPSIDLSLIVRPTDKSKVTGMKCPG